VWARFYLELASFVGVATFRDLLSITLFDFRGVATFPRDVFTFESLRNTIVLNMSVFLIWHPLSFCICLDL